MLRLGLVLSLVTNLLLVGAAGYMVKHRIGHLCNQVSTLTEESKRPTIGTARVNFAQQSSLFRLLPDTEDEIIFLNGLGQYTCRTSAERKALLEKYVLQSLSKNRDWGEIERNRAIVHAIGLYEETMN